MSSAELFKNIPTKVNELLINVENGRIGLPDLQRPFEWNDSKVRDLLDSMMKGYPIGFIMLWSSPDKYENVGYIGENDKTYDAPEDLVIDGQQRLTALLAAMHGVIVRDKKYKERRIRISYNPISKEFAVWSQAYEKSPEWISAISDVFMADRGHKIPEFRRAFVAAYNEGRTKNNLPELSSEEEYQIEQNINDLLNLKEYALPEIKIFDNASEEDVADIFVRVNSGGKKLNETNFIETLLAVYDNDAYEKIETFCSDSRIPTKNTSYNNILEVDPVHLIRVAVGVGFRRARLRYAYMLLRGKDLRTGETNQETRAENLRIFRDALEKATKLNDWHAFLNMFARAGYLNKSFIASSNAVVFGYVLYLIGKYDYDLSSSELQHIIPRWIFMSTITSFYSGSTESEVEKQFADMRNINTKEEYITYLDGGITSAMTEDFFNITLPQRMTTSAATSPEWYGYIAAINVLGKPMFLSTVPVANHLIPGASGTKNSIDKHHIFPKKYLERLGYDSNRDRNQIANFTYIDYQTNIEISDDPPADYVKKYRQRLGEKRYKETCFENALPLNFETMGYKEFLDRRRILMAQKVREAYIELSK
ncbi:DUF262 domain-containing protein [Candidatus Saccharibacteria bacterium]|nr:DUF262 domain-containing protein [Candidatus Saccharibacteria bacterium]